MDKKTIIITGANGFIGNELVHYFAERQYKVYAFARKQPEQLPATAVYMHYDLDAENIDEKAFAQADCIIHCAYVQHSKELKNADEINIKGTKRIIALARKHHLRKFVYLSSLSAHEEAVSHYGKTKLQIEGLFDAGKDLILKPGLVIGNGGLYRTITGIIIKSKFIPLIGGGKQPVQSVFIYDLASVIYKGIENDIRGIFPVGEKVAIIMKQFYTAVSAKLGKHNVFVPLPYWCAELLILTARLIGIKIPITRENILGLKCARRYVIEYTLETFGIELRNYNESIDSLLLQIGEK